MIRKKAVSPVIATVLLIAIGFVLAGIIYSWAGGFISRLSPPAQACNEVNFKAGVFCEENCVLEVFNRGNVDLYGFVVKSIKEGAVVVEETPETFVEAGDSISINLESSYNEGDILLIVPIVLNEKGEQSICADNYGIEVSV